MRRGSLGRNRDQITALLLWGLARGDQTVYGTLGQSSWDPTLVSDISADATAPGKGLTHGCQAVGIQCLQPPQGPGGWPHVLLAEAPVGHTAPAVEQIVLWLL